jgi:hypothetical protein
MDALTKALRKRSVKASNVILTSSRAKKITERSLSLTWSPLASDKESGWEEQRTAEGSLTAGIAGELLNAQSSAAKTVGNALRNVPRNFHLSRLP